MRDLRHIRPARRWTYALLAESAQVVKIGSSSPQRFDARIGDIQLMSPVELTLIARLDDNIERLLHEKFVCVRLHGEWFRYTESVAATIAA
jgi:hypothetical protein